MIEAIQQSDHYRSELSGENRGRGVAMGFWFNGGNESAAYANVNADGTVSLVLGSVDIGGQRASMAMTHAESLGIPYEDVKPTVVDTDSIGWTGTTGGQPHDLRHRLGRARRSPRHPRPARGAVRADLGGPTGTT